MACVIVKGVPAAVADYYPLHFCVKICQNFLSVCEPLTLHVSRQNKFAPKSEDPQQASVEAV